MNKILWQCPNAGQFVNTTSHEHGEGNQSLETVFYSYDFSDAGMQREWTARVTNAVVGWFLLFLDSRNCSVVLPCV